MMDAAPTDASAGVIYCTSGRKYFEDAIVSARSVKRHHPGMKIAVFTEEDDFRDEVFDHHFRIFTSDADRDWVSHYHARQPKKWMLKVICTPRTPFERTVHLDSDTLVVGPIDGLFAMLDAHDVVFTHLDWVQQEAGRNVGLLGLRVPKGINSGVYAYRRSEAALALLGPKWRQDCERDNFQRNEQAILSMYARDPHTHLKGVRWKIADNVVYNATRRMWRTMYEYGLWDDARILHFNETDKLRAVAEGEMARDDLLRLPRVQECSPASLKQIPQRDTSRLIHFHLAKTAGKSLFAAMHAHLGDALVSFNPQRQDAFRDRLRARDWKVVSGHLSGAHAPVRNRLLRRYPFFAVLRDPIDRFHSAYHFIRRTKVSGLHATFNAMDAPAAARYCVAEQIDYGRNSQCSGLIWAETQDISCPNALAAIDARFAFVCTIEQMADLAAFLHERRMIADPAAIPHVNATRPMDPELRAELTQILGDATAEDHKLHRFVLENGPIRGAP